MGLFPAQVSAYLIDKAISSSPFDVTDALKEKPEFAEGRILRNFSEWNERELIYISKLFWDDKFNKSILKGYRGVEVEFNNDGYQIVVNSDADTYELIRLKIQYIANISRFNIRCEQIDIIDFAATCPGCSRIKSPSGAYSGVLGAWLNSGNPSKTIVGITCNHVATEHDKFGSGTTIYSKTGDEIGNVAASKKIHEWDVAAGKRDVNKADIAFIRPMDISIVDFGLGSSNSKPNGECRLSQISRSTKKDIRLFGQTGNPIDGKIVAVAPGVVVGMGKRYKFKDVAVIDVGNFGDSGSLVLSPDDKIGGIFFAVKIRGKTIKGYVNKWRYILSEMNANFSY